VFTAILGIVSLVFFILARLAMTDIFHGEPDQTMEWRMVGISVLPILAFHIVAIVASVVAFRSMRREPR
jgi:hypothetical protein